MVGNLDGCYLDIGGFDFDFSPEAGMPSPFFDYDLCFKAWEKGYAVGYRYVPFSALPPGQYDTGGGTFLYGAKIRNAQQKRNEELCRAKHMSKEKGIADKVAALNAKFQYE